MEISLAKLDRIVTEAFPANIQTRLVALLIDAVVSALDVRNRELNNVLKNGLENGPEHDLIHRLP